MPIDDSSPAPASDNTILPLTVSSPQGVTANVLDLRVATTDLYGPIARQFEASFELQGETTTPFDIYVQVECASGVSFQSATLNFDNGFSSALRYPDVLSILPEGDLAERVSCGAPATLTLTIGDRDSTTASVEATAPIPDELINAYNLL